MNLSHETFLYEYFVFDAMLGKHYDKKALFRELAEIFFLSEKEATELSSAAFGETVSEIRTKSDYFRYVRVCKYHRENGVPFPFSAEEDALISLKGGAILKAEEAELFAQEDAAASIAYRNLIERASGGLILALRVLGVLQCSGQIPDKFDLGVKNLGKAARWGDVVSALSLLRYAKNDRTRNMGIFLACVKDTPCEYLREGAIARVGVAVSPDPAVSILRKGIAAGKVKGDRYDPTVARVVYSDVIGEEDKKALLFSENKEATSEACELPLRLPFSPVEPDREALCKRIFRREQEADAIVNALRNAALRRRSAYLPLCLCSDSPFLRERYFSAIKAALPTAHVEKLEVRSLSARDLELTKNNAFLRSLAEKRTNVCVLFFDGSEEQSAFEDALSFLNGEKRSRFHVNYPAVTLDLGSVLPICICDKENSRKIASRVELLSVKALDKKEKAVATRCLYEEYCELYGVTAGTLAEDALAALSAMPIEKTERAVEKLLSEKGAALDGAEVTTEVIAPYLKGKGEGEFAYGFGGAIYERH